MPTKSELEEQLAQLEQQLAETKAAQEQAEIEAQQAAEQAAQAQAEAEQAQAQAAQVAQAHQTEQAQAESTDITPISYVQPEYTTALAFPQVVKIPGDVAAKNGVERQFVIRTKTSPIPKGVFEWLKQDGRYAPWFVDGDPVSADADQVIPGSEVIDDPNAMTE